MFSVVRAWRNFKTRKQIERDLDDELAAAFELLVDEKVRSGVPLEHARREARLEFGGQESLKEQVRDVRAGVTVERLVQDLRYGLRLLRRNPAFSLVAILTLALGTGANAAMFQLVDAFRLRPLPVEGPDQLVSIGIDQHGRPRMGRREVGRSVFSEPLWQEIRAQQQSFSSVFAWGSGRWDISTGGEVVWADGFYVSGGFFDALGVRAQAGRLFKDADDRKGCGSPGAVLSHEFWQRSYGGHSGVVGQAIVVDRRAFTVIGVAQKGFRGVEVGRTFDVALPLCAEPLLRGRDAGTGRRDFWWLDIMGRLKPEWTLERAQVHLAVISPVVFQATVSPSYTSEWAKDYRAFGLTVTTGRTGVSLLPPVAYAVLWMLFGATGLVLLLTCANLANLMLARAAARRREIGVRLAIGATRMRVIAQLLSESALIAGLGALSGFLLSRWISSTLVTFLNSGSLPVRIVVDLTPDWRVFALTTLVAALVCVLFSLGPALKATRCDPAEALQAGGRSSSDGRDTVKVHRALVVAQIAFSTVLVVGALLFVRTLKELSDSDLGFDPSVLVAAVDLRRTTVQPEARMQAFENIVARLRAVTGVRDAAVTVIVPLSGADWNGRIVKQGVVQNGDAHFNAVGVDYFRVMETPLVKGRSFDHRDQPGGPRATVVNEAFVRRYFATNDPLGLTFQMDGRPAQSYQIVGVVRDAKFLQVGEERPPAPSAASADESRATFLPIAYLAAAQEMVPAPAALRIVVRSSMPAASITPSLTRAITEAVPGAAVSYDSIAKYIDTLLLPQRMAAWLSGFFGVLAVSIAAIGVYGILSYLVVRRKSEIGVRLALGAAPATIMRMIVAESGMVVALGLVIGLPLAAVASQRAAGLLYGVRPLDPTSFAIGTGVLTCVAVLAICVPAFRASRVAPTLVFRE